MRLSRPTSSATREPQRSPAGLARYLKAIGPLITDAAGQPGFRTAAAAGHRIVVIGAKFPSNNEPDALVSGARSGFANAPCRIYAQSLGRLPRTLLLIVPAVFVSGATD